MTKKDIGGTPQLAWVKKWHELKQTQPNMALLLYAFDSYAQFEQREFEKRLLIDLKAQRVAEKALLAELKSFQKVLTERGVKNGRRAKK
jgi:hypothetical protein